MHPISAVPLAISIDGVISGCGKSRNLQVLQNNEARVILDLPRINSSASKALDQLNWKPLFLRRKHRRCIAVYKCLNGLIDYDFNITKNSDIHNLL